MCISAVRTKLFQSLKYIIIALFSQNPIRIDWKLQVTGSEHLSVSRRESVQTVVKQRMTRGYSLKAQPGLMIMLI